jgi:hypothetical protein
MAQYDRIQLGETIHAKLGFRHSLGPSASDDHRFAPSQKLVPIALPPDALRISNRRGGIFIGATREDMR